MVKKILGISSSQPDLRGGFGDHCKLAITPARTFAILTCVDERLDPAKYSGLTEGDTHVFRKCRGRVSNDAIRSLVIALGG